MTETSALDAFIRAKKPNFDMAEYRAALASDWERGDPEKISELETDGTGGIIRNLGFVGYVGTMRFDHTPLTDFRSIRRNENPTWREVVAKDIDGRVWYVGKIKRQNGRAAKIDELRQPHPDQARIDAEAAALLHPRLVVDLDDAR